MKFPPAILDEIRARLPVSAVAGRRVRLQKAGREWKGLSPFGAEKTPSFFVNDQKGSFFDFSSGKNGDIFKFVMETEGLSFPEAVERLAAEAGVPLPKMTREAQAQEEQRQGLHEVVELAAAFFEAELASERGGAARRYLSGRGLEGEARRMFRLGYAPAGRFALRDHLAGKGVSPDMMMEAGLLVHGDEIAVPYDKFRDRVMFPICDGRGRVVAFGGRALGPDVPAKYMNSPETPLFHKGRLLFNHHLARKAAHDAGTVIVVEGYVDVIAMTLAGFPQVVAPMGTALTEDQLALLWRMADEPIICLDGDKAGRKAAWRTIDVALPALEPGKSLRFASLPEGQDPDDLAREGGRAAVSGVLDVARPLVDMLWMREVEAGPVDTPERRAALERRLKDALGAIKDETTRRHYRAEIEARLAEAFAPTRQQGRPAYGRAHARQAGSMPGRGSGPGGGGFRGQPAAHNRHEPLQISPGFAQSRLIRPVRGENPREAFIIMALLAHRALIGVHADDLAELALEGQGAEYLRQALLDSLGENDGPDSLDISHLDARLAQPRIQEALNRLSHLIRAGDRQKIAPESDPERVSDAIRQAIVLHHRARTLHTELRAAERALAEDATETNLTWLQDVLARLQNIEGTEADTDD